WRRSDTGTWSSDDENFCAPRHNLGFNKKGEMYFLDEAQRQHTVRTSGQDEVRKEDNSLVFYDRKGAVLGTLSAKGERRTFEYDDLRLVRVVSDTARGGADIWVRRSDDNVEITGDGDI